MRRLGLAENASRVAFIQANGRPNPILPGPPPPSPACRKVGKAPGWFAVIRYYLVVIGAKFIPANGSNVPTSYIPTVPEGGPLPLPSHLDIPSLAHTT